MARKIRLEWDFDNKQLDDTLNKWRDINKELVDAANKFDKVNQEAKRTSGMLDSKHLNDINTELNDLSKNFDKLDDSIKDAGKNLGNFTKTAQSATQGMNNLGNAAKNMGNAKPFSGFAQGADAMAGKLGMLNNAFSAFSGAAQGSFGGVAQMAGNLGAMAGPWGVVAGAAVTAGVAVTDFTQRLINEVKPQLQETRTVFNEFSQDEVARMTAQVQALTNKMGGDFSENLKTTQELMYTFGISTGEADEIMQNLLLNLTPAQANEALDWVREYDTQFRTLGFTAEETAQVLINSMDMGVYQDKAFDAIKEFGLRINDIPDSAQRALRDAKLWQVYEQMRNGTITAKEGMIQLTGKLREMQAAGKDITPLTTAIFGAAGEDMGAGIVNLDKILTKQKEISAEEKERQERAKAEKKAEEEAMVARNRLVATILGLFGGAFSSIDQLISKIKEQFFIIVERIVNFVDIIMEVVEAFWELYTFTRKFFIDFGMWIARFLGLDVLFAKIGDRISSWIDSIQLFGSITIEIFKRIGDLAAILSKALRSIFTGGIEGVKNVLKNEFMVEIDKAIKAATDRASKDFKGKKFGSGEVVGSYGSKQQGYIPKTDFDDQQKIAEKRLDILKQSQINELEIEKQRKLQSIEVKGDKQKELDVEIDFSNRKYKIEKDYAEAVRSLQLNKEKHDKAGELKRKQSELDFQKQREQAEMAHQKEIEALQFKARDEIVNDEKLTNEERFNNLTDFYTKYYDKLKEHSNDQVELEIKKITQLIQIEKDRYSAFVNIQNISNSAIEEEQKKHDEIIKKLTQDLTNAQIKSETDKTIAFENARMMRKQMIEQEKKVILGTIGDLSDLGKSFSGAIMAGLDAKAQIKELEKQREMYRKAGDQVGADFVDGMIMRVKGQAIANAAQNVVNGITSTLQDINNIRLAQEDAVIKKNNEEIAQLQEIVKIQQEQNAALEQRDLISNKLAENRIKELETLSETIPEAEKERARKLIQIEKDKIQQSIDNKKKEQSAEEKRIKELEQANKEAEERKKKIQRENFDIQKAAQIVQITISTAQAAISAFSSLVGIPVVGPALGAAAAAVAAAFGATQIALVASQPNPYQKGTLNVEGPIKHKDSVHAILQPGEAVIPVATNQAYSDTMEAIFYNKVPPAILNDFVKSYRIKKFNGTGQGNTIVVNSDSKSIVDAIREKPVVNINIDDDGLAKYVERQNEITRIRDKKLRIKI